MEKITQLNAQQKLNKMHIFFSMICPVNNKWRKQDNK